MKSYLGCVLRYNLGEKLGGQNRPPNLLRHVLTTECDGGGQLVSCASSHRNELYDLNGLFKTVPIISTRKIILFSSIAASLKTKFRFSQAC